MAGKRTTYHQKKSCSSVGQGASEKARRSRKKHVLAIQSPRKFLAKLTNLLLKNLSTPPSADLFFSTKCPEKKIISGLRCGAPEIARTTGKNHELPRKIMKYLEKSQTTTKKNHPRARDRVRQKKYEGPGKSTKEGGGPRRGNLG